VLAHTAFEAGAFDQSEKRYAEVLKLTPAGDPARNELVERQADRAAERALESGKEIELEAMSSTERRIVHQHLKDRSGIETFSEGSEPERCVVVAPLVAD